MADAATRKQAGLALAACAVLLVIAVLVPSFVPTRTDAPDFTLTSTGYENGVQGNATTFSLSDYRGNVVVLDMMAVACTSCRVVTKDTLVPLAARHAATPDVVILSIDTWADPATGSLGGETTADVIELQKDEGVPWRHALDTDQVYRKYAAIALPRLVVVDRDGDVILAEDGLVGLETVDRAVRLGLEGTAPSAGLPQYGLVALALAAGLASFFAPCSIGLVPAYLGLLVRSDERRTPLLVGGGLAAAGMVLAYAGLAGALAALAYADHGRLLRQVLPGLELAMGILLVALGVALFAKRDWSALAARLGAGRLDGRKGFFAFGLAYSLASFACTGPVFLPVLLAGLDDGVAGLALAFAAYAAVLAACLVVLAILVSRGHDAAAQWFVRHARLVSSVSAALIVVGGAYLVAFYLYARA